MRSRPPASDSRSHGHAADFLHGPPRAKILCADEKDGTVHEPERMQKHEPLHFAIVAAAPVGSSQERPADFYFAPLTIVTVKPRRSDDPAISPVDCDQRTGRFQRFTEKSAELLLLVAVRRRMLLPNVWVRSHREEIVEIRGLERPESEELAFEHGLQIEGSCAHPEPQGTSSKNATAPVSSEYLRPDHDETVVSDQPLEQLRPVPQVLDGGANVRPNRLAKQDLPMQRPRRAYRAAPPTDARDR